jgi:hypothetical protein
MDVKWSPDIITYSLDRWQHIEERSHNPFHRQRCYSMCGYQKKRLNEQREQSWQAYEPSLKL